MAPLKRIVRLAAVMIAGAVAAPAFGAEALPRHLNKMIEKLSAGQVAMTLDDWTWIDMEHGPYSIDGLQKTMFRFAEERQPNGQLKSTPLVRIPVEGPDSNIYRYMVKQVLERGAFGVIFPRVDNVEQAQRAVKAMRFPPMPGAKIAEPRGVRGCGCFLPPTWPKMTTEEYVGNRGDLWPLNPNGELVAFMMIESGEGVKNAKALLNTPGVTGLIVAPNDLGMDIGAGPADKWPFPAKTEEAIDTVIKVCKAEKKICGFATTMGEVEVKKRIEQGFNFIARSFPNVDKPYN